jgi:glycosyltransferase involved in cell wall biosynthesis
MKTKLFSVIIPNYNDIRIERAIKSILQQKNRNYELIIVDGGSTNTSVNEIYLKYSNKINILIQEPDKGVFDALNKGVLASTAKFIFLMGSDDQLKDALTFSSIETIIKENINITGVCIDCLFINADGKIVRKWIPKKVTKNRIKWGILPPHFSLFLNRTVYDRIGVINLSEGKIGLDSLWLLQLTKLNDFNIRVCNDHAMTMEIGGESTRSFENIFRGYLNFTKKARRMNFKNWFIIGIIKTTSKMLQFRI